MKHRKFTLYLFLLSCFLGSYTYAQVNFLGKPGLMAIPTAAWEQDRPLGLSFAYLPDAYSIFTSARNLDQTNLYNARVSFTSFLDVNLSIAHRPDRAEVSGVGDRHLDFRFRILKEGKYRPSLVLGVTPPGSVSPLLAHDYLVATKTFKSDFGEFSASLGYGSPFVFVKSEGGFLGIKGIRKDSWRQKDYGQSYYLSGFYGGLSYRPVEFAGLMLEYDTQRVNAGVFVELWDWLLLQGYTFEGKEWAFTAGGNFRLDFLPRALKRHEKHLD